MKTKLLLLGLCCLGVFTTLHAQVGVGTTNPQSTLDIEASNVTSPTNSDGILIPRVSNFPASNPTAAQDGMLVFYTGTASSGKGFYYWDQSTSSWIFLTGAKKINDLLDGKSDDDGSQNGSSLFIGELAGLEDDGTDNRNVGIGYFSLAEGANRTNNTAVGYSSLSANDQGNNNTAIGYNSMWRNRFGHNNTAVGFQSLAFNNDGENNVAIGYNAGYNLLSGDNNTFLGYGAGNGTGITTTGSVFLGYQAGSSSSGSNQLYIENTNANASNALIYGEFGTDNSTTGNLLRTNSEFQIGNPSGTGYAFPTVDGTVNQVLVTDGAGQLSFLDASSLGGNTLDQAYDQGGAGAGRTITADSGAVIIEGTGGLRVESSSENHMLFVDGTDNAVGIGENTPISPLHIGVSTAFDLNRANTGQDGIFIKGGDDNSGLDAIGGSISFGGAATTRANGRKSAISLVQTSSNQDQNGMAFYVHPTAANSAPMEEAMRITHQKYLGINNTSPSATLDVVGTMQFVDGNEAAGYVLSSDAAGNASWTDPSTIFTDTDTTYDGTDFALSNQSLPIGQYVRGIDAFGNLIAATDQDSQTLNLVGSTLSISNGNSVNLASLASNDADWHEEGTSSAPNNISDNMFTLGNVAIGANVNATANLLVYSNTQPSGINLSRYYANTTVSGAGGINSFTNIQNGSTGWYYNVGSSLQSTTDVTGTMYNYRAVNNMRSLSSSQSPHYLYYGLFSTNTGANVNAKRYGSYIEYSTNTTSLGDKYGHYTIIPSTLSGTHYGFYSDVQNSLGYAAYLIGRTELGESTSNRYRMPASDGSVNQVIRTDGSGNLSFVNASTVFTDTDDQTIDTFSFNSSTNVLTLEIENDGVAAQTVDLSSLTDNDWTEVGADIERQSGDVYIGDTSGTDNDLYISNSIIDWDDNSYLIDPGSESFVNEINFDAGSNTDPSITFDADTNTGFYRSEPDAIGFTSNGTARMQFTTRGQIEFTNIGNSTFIGFESGQNDDFSNNQNVGVGDYTLADNTTGQANAALGYLALRNNETGNSNVGVGYGTLFNNISGDFNVALGRNALGSNNDGSQNIGIGNQALSNNTSGDNNVAIGHQALINTIGNYNIGIGQTAGNAITSGARNIAIGYRAQAAHTTGNDNIVLGDRAMDTSTTSSSNIALGRNALTNMTEGDNNIAIGQMALGMNVGASPNAANNNIAIGHQAGQYAEGDNNIYIGYQAGRNDGIASNHLYIENSSADSNNALIYGEFDNDILRFNGNVGIGRTPSTNALEVEGEASKATAGAFIANSDQRLKTNIETISTKTALQKLLSLRGVSYEWNDNQTETKRPEGIQYGFIAQELMEVFPEKVTKDNLGFYQTAYGDYDAFFVQAIKELNNKVETLEAKNAELQEKLNKLEALEARILALEGN